MDQESRKPASRNKVPGFYEIEHVETGKKYIGSTAHLYLREHNHRSRLRLGKHPNPALQEAYDRSPDLTFRYVVTDTLEEARQSEQAALDAIFDDEAFFNISRDVRRPTKGLPVSQETREKLSKVSKGRIRSEETRGRISEALRVRVANGDEHYAPERMLLLSQKAAEKNSRSVTVDGITYPSMRAACQKLGIAHKTLVKRYLGNNTMANDFRPAPRAKNALDNRKLNLLAPCPTAPGKTSAMTTNVFTAEKTGEPNVRMTVFTRDPEDQGERNGYGKIVANLDPIVFFAFLDALEGFANGEAGKDDKLKLEEKGYGFFGGKRSEAPVVKSELHFGKDADGVVWVSIILPNRPKIKFPFGPSDFYNLVHKSGEQVSKAEASVMWAKGWINLMRQMVPHYLIQGFKDVPYEPQGGRQGGGGGGGNWNNNRGGGQGGGNGGGQTRQVETVTASDDDIPW